MNWPNELVQNFNSLLQPLSDLALSVFALALSVSALALSVSDLTAPSPLLPPIYPESHMLSQGISSRISSPVLKMTSLSASRREGVREPRKLHLSPPNPLQCFPKETISPFQNPLTLSGLRGCPFQGKIFLIARPAQLQQNHCFLSYSISFSFAFLKLF